MADLIMIGQCFMDPDKSDRTRRVLNKFTPDVLCVESTKTLHDLVIDCTKRFSDFLKEEQVRNHPRYDELKGVYHRHFGGYDTLIRYTGPGFPMLLIDDPSNPICQDNEAALSMTKDFLTDKPSKKKLDYLLKEANTFLAIRNSIMRDVNNSYGLYHASSMDPLLKGYQQIMHPDNMSRDIHMEKELRRIREEYRGKSILWLGNISRLCEDAYGWTLYRRIANLHPVRFALDEIDVPDRVE